MYFRQTGVYDIYLKNIAGGIYLLLIYNIYFLIIITIIKLFTVVFSPVCKHIPQFL